MAPSTRRMTCTPTHAPIRYTPVVKRTKQRKCQTGSFQSLVSEIAKDLGIKVRFEGSALCALQEASESILVTQWWDHYQNRVSLL